MPRRGSTMVWRGLREYLAELQKLPEEAKAEAAKQIEGEVNAAYVTVKRVYLDHQHTGTLAKRLTIAPMAGGLVLRSGSPIAWLFDNGSKARHWATGKSTGAMWGKTPPTHIFAATVAKGRRRLTLLFKEMLKRRGAATVTGD
jgi:hypothetical protein